MNYKTFIVLILQAFIAYSSFARTITVDGITFGDTDGDLVRIGVSLPKSELPKVKPQMIAVLEECRGKNLHPFKWQAYAPVGVTFIWTVSGDLEKISQLLEGYTKGSSTYPVWIWNGAKQPNLSLKINMASDGKGWVQLLSGDWEVGYTPCLSSPRAKQLDKGDWSISSIGQEDQDGEMGVTSKKWTCWMPWAVKVRNTNDGCYIHGGSLVDLSDGCIHVPRPMAKIIYHLVKKGTEVEVVYF